MSHAMVVALCFPTVRSVANRPKQRANTKKALTRNETGAAAEQQWVWRREEGCSVVVWSRLHATIANPVNFRPLTSDKQVQGSSEAGSQYSSAMAPQGPYDMQWTRVHR
ncbi:hypothetical protein ACSBR2_020441 [Camellia fascicularis]